MEDHKSNNVKQLVYTVTLLVVYKSSVVSLLYCACLMLALSIEIKTCMLYSIIIIIYYRCVRQLTLQ